jgi:hypothetical protein
MFARLQSTHAHDAEEASRGAANAITSLFASLVAA